MIQFKQILEKNREFLEKKRFTFKTDVEFARSLGVTATTIGANMGPRGTRYVAKTYDDFDIEEANKKRISNIDSVVAKSIGISTAVLINRCGTRKSIGLGKLEKPFTLKKSKKENKSEEKKKLELMQESHEVEYSKLKTLQQIEYEERWKSDAIDLNRPHPALYEHKKCTS